MAHRDTAPRRPQLPTGWRRLAVRLPILLFRVGLGPLFGKRLLLLHHVGRFSGLDRRVILEVVSHDPADASWTVASGFGPKADWYQNLHAAAEDPHPVRQPPARRRRPLPLTRRRRRDHGRIRPAASPHGPPPVRVHGPSCGRRRGVVPRGGASRPLRPARRCLRKPPLRTRVTSRTIRPGRRAAVADFPYTAAMPPCGIRRRRAVRWRW